MQHCGVAGLEMEKKAQRSVLVLVILGSFVPTCDLRLYAALGRRAGEGGQAGRVGTPGPWLDDHLACRCSSRGVGRRWTWASCCRS